VSEARDNVLPNQVLRLRVITLRWHLHLQLALAKLEVQNLLHAGGGCRRDYALVLGDLVAAGYTKIDASLTHEGRDIGGGEEDQRKREVLDEGNVEP